MSRTIKFRAWGPNTKNMWLWDDIKHVSLMDLTITGEKIVMQYTGLKDKNGVETYESDLLADGDGNPLKVVWESYFAQFAMVYIHGGYRVEMIKDELSENYTVIGNIHENPDLLNGNRG